MNEEKTGTLLIIDNIKSFSKNKKHVGDYFLKTSDNITFWLKDPLDILSENNQPISSLSGYMKTEKMENGKVGQYIVLQAVEWFNPGEEMSKENFQSNEKQPKKDTQPGKSSEKSQPNYANMSDEDIVKYILEKKAQEEKVNGIPFVKFREKVVNSQAERHKALLKSIKKAAKSHTEVMFEDIDKDPNYFAQSQEEQKNFQARVGNDTMIGNNLGMLDGSPQYNMNHDVGWGDPSKRN